ncbi:MAG: glutaminase family protein [Pirellulaceae bacterium]
MKQTSVLLTLFWCGAVLTHAEPPSFRPPAVPLVTHDPYFSIWSPADRLAEADTVHWTGRPHRLTSLVRIDGQVFRLLGREPADVPALAQNSVEVLPTRTISEFEGPGVRLTLTWLTPALPGDLMICSRPVTYVTWTTRSTDTREHEVQIYFEAAAEIAIHNGDPRCAWREIHLAPAHLSAVCVGTTAQPVLAKKGDDLRIDWGHLYLATVQDVTLGKPGVASPMEMARRFADAGPPEIHAATSPPEMPASALALSVCLDAGRVSSTPVSRWIMLAYDDEYSIQYFGKKLRPYWRRDGADAAGLLERAAADYPLLTLRCAHFDEQLLADLTRAGGRHYAQLCALAYRQTFAGNKIAADASGMPLMFPKENFSNGCIGTVDVLFPQAPFFLALSPALTKAMLVPILDYAASPLWPYGYAPHDLGTYPHATGQVYGMGGDDGGRMPVEESGNMLIMVAALAKSEGNAEFARKYWPLLTTWADYLVANGLDPENQLCSADMFGHLPHCANLALKAIIGLGGYAQLCESLGKADEAAKYWAVARDYAAKWQTMANDEGRTRLAYHLPGTWGMKHNLIWDRVLGTRLFPDSVGDAEIAWYLKVQKPFGLPVDNRTDTSLIDWAMWSIAPARSNSDFQALVEPLFRYAHETPSRVPLSDWFVTTDAQQKGFQARPVVGGIFIRWLTDELRWRRWADAAASVRGDWAPLPEPPAKPTNVLVPTAQAAPITWRYTLEKPGDEWCQPGFDDSAWKEGPAGFGTAGTPGAIVRTVWNTQEIWLRREFTLSGEKLNDPQWIVHYDEDAEIIVNGVHASELMGWTTGYEPFPMSTAAVASLRPGRNLLAVHCRQTTGGQYIDVGLADTPSVAVSSTPPGSSPDLRNVKAANVNRPD